MRITASRWIAVMLALSMTGFAFAVDKPARDGFWWSSSNSSLKLGFVLGYTAAMDQAGVAQMGECIGLVGLLKDQFPGQNLVQKFCLDKPDFDSITMGQFVDGVDAFYRDFRNKQLDVNWAMQYVRDEIKGKPAKELEDEVTRWRACQAAYSTGDSKKILDACK